MTTCVAVLLCAVGALPGPLDHTWLSDYGQALQRARTEGAPLLVVIHEPADATHRLDQAAATVNPAAASADPSASRLLGNYVLCDVDVSTPYGQRVAKVFRATSYPYTVIIDRTTSVQIFRKTGQLSAAEWSTTLARHKDGERAVSFSREIYREPVFCST